MRALCATIFAAAMAISANADITSVSGVYPHLAMFNDEGECGTGAVVPWAGSLWVVTYGPHCPVGSTDKLYRIKPDLTRETFAGSVGGTPANRMIHRETNQLLIGPYVIDAKGNVRVVSPAKMPGRLTGAARHLVDPANKVYVATMETGLYELDMRTLDVNTLIRENGKNDKEIGSLLSKNGFPWPVGWETAPVTHVPGYHAKGLASGFGRIFVSNNGEDSKEARRNPFVPSGVLAWWNENGRDWTTIRRCQFTEIATPDGIYGNEHPESNPSWAMGGDAKSVILGVGVLQAAKGVACIRRRPRLEHRMAAHPRRRFRRRHVPCDDARHVLEVPEVVFSRESKRNPADLHLSQGHRRLLPLGGSHRVWMRRPDEKRVSWQARAQEGRAALREVAV